MPRAQRPKPHRPSHDVPEERDPPALPVEPDEGPVPALIPDDPEDERVIAPAARQARPAQRTGRQVEVAGCP